MELNLKELSFLDLKSLMDDINLEISSREAEEKNKAKKQIMELAKSYGLSIEDILSGKNPNKSKPVADKYWHPENKTLRWSGRGRKPVWMQELLDTGKTLEDCLIPVTDERQQELPV